MAEKLARYSRLEELIEGRQTSQRWLSELVDVFASSVAYENALQSGDKLVYSVTTIEPAVGEGQLHYGLGVVLPGKVGDEYFLTRGHLHAFRAAAEVYICLRGIGLMLLEDERSGECRSIRMAPESAVYVPGYNAHRTVNTGNEPLVYWGVYPHNAGHDYQTIQQRNFKQVVVCIETEPVVIDRSEYLKRMASKGL
jgi:glucose-6-phosphate isomerase